MNKDGTGYTVLHEFQRGPNDGANAIQVLVEGDKLFGVTNTGGRENEGTVFRSNLDGSDYEIVHEFGFGPDNGRFPNNDLVVIGSTLYGSARWGGEFGTQEDLGGGIVYALPLDTNAVPEPVSILVWLVLGSVWAVRDWAFMGRRKSDVT